MGLVLRSSLGSGKCLGKIDNFLNSHITETLLKHSKILSYNKRWKALDEQLMMQMSYGSSGRNASGEENLQQWLLMLSEIRTII